MMIVVKLMSHDTILNKVVGRPKADRYPHSPHLTESIRNNRNCWADACWIDMDCKSILSEIER